MPDGAGAQLVSWRVRQFAYDNLYRNTGEIWYNNKVHPAEA